MTLVCHLEHALFNVLRNYQIQIEGKTKLSRDREITKLNQILDEPSFENILNPIQVYSIFSFVMLLDRYFEIIYWSYFWNEFTKSCSSWILFL